MIGAPTIPTSSRARRSADGTSGPTGTSACGQRWSNDRFLSTPHGVLNDSGKDRYSIAFFYSPNVDATVECVPTCVSSDNPARYPRAVYRDLVLEFYNANYFHRKDYAGAAEAAGSATPRP